MPPDIYTPVRKIWGSSQVCYCDEQVEVVRIVVLPGGYCSRHLHRRKSNEFIVTRGSLSVFRHRSGENASDGLPAMEIEELSAGNHDRTRVAPGVEHRFRSLEGAIAYEVYTAIPGEVIGSGEADIERFDEGGRD